MTKKLTIVFTTLCIIFLHSVYSETQQSAWIRINQLGYHPQGIKIAVMGAKASGSMPRRFKLIDAASSKVVFKSRTGKNLGAYGPFQSSARMDFSEFKTPGTYYLQAGSIRSPVFTIKEDVYKGSADFALRYMRQQRCGFNPFLKDSCHTHDGYTLYGPMPDGTFVDVKGGWHDASDYLQYSTTSANAAYHLLAAYRDYPKVFTDKYGADGLEGNNGKADVLDEASWGLKWMLKMHPRPDWMFNQIADDRDHAGFRLPSKDSVDYGWGKGTGRPVYFVSGTIQGIKDHKNRATGTASIAGKFASTFALGAQLYSQLNPALADTLKSRSLSAYQFGRAKPGVAQTAPGGAPYFYEEDNWTDDMELGAAVIYQLTKDKT